MADGAIEAAHKRPCNATAVTNHFICCRWAARERRKRTASAPTAPNRATSPKNEPTAKTMPKGVVGRPEDPLVTWLRSTETYAICVNELTATIQISSRQRFDGRRPSGKRAGIRMYSAANAGNQSQSRTQAASVAAGRR